MKRIILFLLLLCYVITGQCQDGWVYHGNFNFGCNYTLNYSRGSSAFPGLKVFCGFSASGVYKGHFLLNYGPSLSFYTKSIGANLNPLISDVQIDLVNSLSFGAGANDLPYFKLFRTLDNEYLSTYNTVEFSFDQFTGYSPLLFEACNMLGIYIPNYNLQYDESSRGPKPTNYNTSMYDLKVFFMKGYGIDVGALGSLKDISTRRKKEIYYGLQDIIHIRGGFSLHPNNDNQHFFIGGTYNNLNNVSIK